MTPEQLKLLRSLFRVVAGVGDGLGSEGTDSGMVLTHRFGTMKEAVAGLFPRGWRVVPLGFEGFVRKYAGEGTNQEVQALVRLLGHFPVDVAYVGGDDFKPDAHSRGVFWICFFVDCLEAAGTRVLVAFERVET